MIVPAASTVPRTVLLVCAKCTRPITAGQLHRLTDPPRHAFCDPPARLDVARVAQAARAR